MIDLISRQAAIDTMVRLQTEDIEMYGCAIPEGFDGDRAAEALKALPPAQPERKTGRWIPCSERLPEHDVTVLVWVYDNYYLSNLHLIDDVLYWDFDDFCLSGDDFDDVIAWMPLPKPYGEDDYEK